MLDERPSPLQLTGAVVVLAGVVFVASARRAARRRSSRRHGQDRRVSAAAEDLTVRRIGRLLPMTAEPTTDAALVVRAGRVAWSGPDADLPAGRA